MLEKNQYPESHVQCDDRPDHDENPDIDLLAGDTKEGCPIIEKSNTPVKDDVDPFNLIGNWKGFRECHLKPDLLLIYRLTSDGKTLELARIGSHSELFS